MSLRRYTWRSMQLRPGRTILTMLSIVIGVTATVAVGLGTATTRNAYKQMFAMVTGRATLEIDAAGGGSFAGDVFDKVIGVSGVVAAAPLIDRPTSMPRSDGDGRIRLQILGIDPERDPSVRDYDIVSGRAVKEGDELVVEEGFAEYVKLKVGDEVKLLTKRLSKPFTIVGLLRPKSGAAMTQSAIAFLPIERAKYHFNPSDAARRNQIDKIQVVTAADVDPDEVQPRIAAVLPEGLQVHRPAASTQLMQETLRSSEQGLKLTTRFSLLMAIVIIINTFFMNVSERRRQLSIMRAIGATRHQVRRSLLFEALLLGVVGTVLGTIMGVVLAFVGTQLVGRAFDVQLPRLVEVMTPWPFIFGAIFGIVTALVGALVPAIVASRVSPLEGMNRSPPARSRNFVLIFAGGGALLTCLGAGIILANVFGWLHWRWALDAGPMVLIGVVMLNGAALGPQARFVAWLMRPFLRVETGLALKQVLRHHARSALTVGVLFIAGSTGVGMANSILDCVKDVHDWVSDALIADYFVRAMMPDMATGDAADLPDGLGDELKQVPNIESIDSAAFVEAKVAQPGQDPSDYMTVIVVAREYTEREPPFDLVEGNRAQIGDRVRAGDVVIGTVLAHKLNLKLGDRLPLETSEGIKQVPICGIANEYMVGGLAVHMYYEQAARWLGVEGVDGYAIKAKPGFREAIKPDLEKICRKYDVFLLSQGDIRRNVDRIVSGAEWSLWLLVVMGFVVAAFGIANTLTMNVLEQTRELGLLRIVAMTKKQVRRTIEAQALIVGGVGLPSGIAMGVLIAWVLNLAMMPSIGHPIEFHLHARMLIWTFVGAAVIVMIAAFIPARRATQINVVEALHYE